MQHIPCDSSYSRRRIERAAEHYLQECFRLRTAARVTEFAERLGLTRPHVSEVVIGLFGKPLRAVFLDRQIQRAEELLASTTYPIREIAVRCAFGTERTFFRAFRAYRKTSPAAYRADLTKCQ